MNDNPKIPKISTPSSNVRLGARNTCRDGHRSRPVRDANGRELGYLCLECGRLIRRRGPIELLETCSLAWLNRSDVEIGDGCRRELERTLRRERRRANTVRQEPTDV